MTIANNALAERAMLVTLSVSIWSARKNDTRISDKVAAEHGADRSMGRYAKHLIPRELLTAVTAANHALRDHHNLNTLAWGDDGTRVLPAANFFGYQQHQRSLEDQFGRAVRNFIACYPDYVETARKALNGLFDPRDYPAPDQIAEKFGVSRHFLPVAQSDDFRVSLGDVHVAQIKAEIEARNAELVSAANRDLWQRVHNVTARLVERLSAYEVDPVEGTRLHPFRDSLIDNVRALLDLSYAQMKADTPRLGAPLPGDLGRPILERQGQLGAAADQAAEAERQRLAQQSEKAHEAGLFFQLNARPSQVDPAAAGQGTIGPMAAAPAAGEQPRLALDLAKDQNNQQRKLDFLDQRDAKGIYDRHSLQTPVSPYQVMAGSVIAASLITGINSDLPGEVTAQVTENVYDSVSGQTLLIPQGARLIGTYDSVVAFGQSRALLVWQRIIMPDGSSIEIDNLPATDAAGYAGLSDEVDYHTWALLKGVALSTLLGVGTEVTFGSQQSNLVQAIRESTQQNVNQAGQRITEKNLNIQPTITIRPGWPLRVIVHKDLVLRPYRG